MENKNNVIIEFRDTELLKRDVEVLKELESLTGKKFFNVEIIKYNTKMGFVTKNKRVSGIDLSNCGLKFLPESIGSLKGLETLWLRDNNIKYLPDSISQLTSLNDLFLYNNKIEKLPESIVNLTKLESLSLSHNLLKNLPEKIGNLKELKKLFLLDNRLKELPESIGYLNSLESLDIKENNLLSLPESFICLLMSNDDLIIDVNDGLTNFLSKIKIKKTKFKFFNSIISKILKRENNLSEEASLFIIKECLSWNLLGLKPLLKILESDKLYNKRVEDRAINEINRIINDCNRKFEKIFSDFESTAYEESDQINTQKILKSVKDAQNLAKILWNRSVGHQRNIYSNIRIGMTDLIGELEKKLSKSNLIDKLKKAGKKLAIKIRKYNIGMSFFYLCYFLIMVISIYSIKPYFNFVPQEMISIVLIISIIFTFFKGIGLLPTLSNYIERSVKIVDFISNKFEKEKFIENRNKIKLYLLRALDLLVILYLINAFHNIIKIGFEIEIILLELTLEWFDIIFMSIFISIIGAILTINETHNRGIAHLWKSSLEEIEATKRNRHLILIFGIIGIFCYFLIMITTWKPYLEFPNYLAISIGSILYIENRFKKRWRLRFLFYVTIGTGLTMTYIITSISNIIFGVIIIGIFAFIFLFIWIENYRRTLWLSEKFEFPWHSVLDKACIPIYGQLISPDQLKPIKDIFKNREESIENILNESDIEIKFRKVTTLDLSGNNIKTLPDSLKDLTSIKKLIIDDNNLLSFPLFIANLKNLNYLSLSGNNIDKIPDYIRDLRSLKHLSLSNNNLTKIPDSIGNLQSVTELYIDGNSLMKLPNSIGNLESLDSLNFSDNQLNYLPKTIGNLRLLKYLNLKSNNLENIPDAIGDLKSLEYLDLSNNNLKSLPNSIGKLSSVENLVLDNNKISQLPETIGNLIMLKKLWLSENELSNLPNSIGKLTSLKYLSFSNNKIIKIPESIGNLISLTQLDLEDNNLKNLPNSLGDLKSLLELYLSKNQIEILPERIGNLETLNFLYIDNNGLKIIPNSIGNLRFLEHLILKNNNIKNLPESLDNLKYLEILHLQNNKIEILPKSLLDLTNLRQLFIMNNPLNTSSYEVLKKMREKGLDVRF